MSDRRINPKQIKIVRKWIRKRITLGRVMLAFEKAFGHEGKPPPGKRKKYIPTPVTDLEVRSIRENLVGIMRTSDVSKRAGLSIKRGGVALNHMEKFGLVERISKSPSVFYWRAV